MCLMTTLKEWVRRFRAVSTRQWVEEAGIWACQKWQCGRCCISGYVLNRTRCDGCRPLQRTCYTGCEMSLITGWMCVVWPRVHTVKVCNERMRNLDSCRLWRCMLCPCNLRNKFVINFWNRTIPLCIPCVYIHTLSKQCQNSGRS
jgi:hypothetical protein